MISLFIDTSLEDVSIALIKDGKLLSKIINNIPGEHSIYVTKYIDDILKETNLSPKDVDEIIVVNGPGSFTGIRIGIATIKPMAEVYNIPIAAVTSLECLAVTNKSDTIISLIDARNNQVYAGIFDENINLKEEYMADDINLVLEKANKYENAIFVGDGSLLHKDLILEKINSAKFVENNEQNAINIGIVGYKKYLEKDLKNADTILPIYLRNK